MVAKIRLSIVSHDQDHLVHVLLDSLAACCPEENLAITVVHNVPDAPCSRFASCPFPVKVWTNPGPLGFAANHNRVFATCREQYFCVLNPDIVFMGNPFQGLLRTVRKASFGVVAPFLYDSSGVLQDNGRPFPTPVRLARRCLDTLHARNKQAGGTLPPRERQEVDWIAGMFMFFPAEVYGAIGGFDEGYFMYYEDVDICFRLRQAGLLSCRIDGGRIVHDAARQSHRDARYLRWHLSSMGRFFGKYASEGLWSHCCR